MELHTRYKADTVPACKEFVIQEYELDPAEPEVGSRWEIAWFWGQASHPSHVKLYDTRQVDLLCFSLFISKREGDSAYLIGFLLPLNRRIQVRCVAYA